MSKLDQKLEKLGRENAPLIPRRQRLRQMTMAAPPPETPGSADWLAAAVFGTVSEFERMFEALVVGGGAAVDDRWRQMLSLMVRARAAEQPYTLNQLCVALDVPFGELTQFVGRGTAAVYGELARQKVKMALPQVVEATVAAGMDLEKGTKDREMLLKIGGVLENGGGGVNVSVNQQVMTKVQVGKDELLSPLRQFSGLNEELDGVAKGQVIDGEILEEGD